MIKEMVKEYFAMLMVITMKNISRIIDCMGKGRIIMLTVVNMKVSLEIITQIVKESIITQILDSMKGV